MSDRPTQNAAEKCGVSSPIYKFDTGPVKCELPKGHDGKHCATSYEEQDKGMWRSWPK